MLNVRCSHLHLLSSLFLNSHSQLSQLALVAARENREAAPGFGVEVFVVEMEAGGVALALPLVAAPEPEEPLDPEAKLRPGILGKARGQRLEHVHRRELVAN